MPKGTTFWSLEGLLQVESLVHLMLGALVWRDGLLVLWVSHGGAGEGATGASIPFAFGNWLAPVHPRPHHAFLTLESETPETRGAHRWFHPSGVLKNWNCRNETNGSRNSSLLCGRAVPGITLRFQKTSPEGKEYVSPEPGPYKRMNLDPLVPDWLPRFLEPIVGAWPVEQP